MSIPAATNKAYFLLLTVSTCSVGTAFLFLATTILVLSILDKWLTNWFTGWFSMLVSLLFTLLGDGVLNPNPPDILVRLPSLSLDPMKISDKSSLVKILEWGIFVGSDITLR